MQMFNTNVVACRLRHAEQRKGRWEPRCHRAQALNTPDEPAPSKGKLKLVAHGDRRTIGRLTLQPGWKWSAHVKRSQDQEAARRPTFSNHVAGHLRFAWTTGPRSKPGPGDVTCLPLENRSCATPPLARFPGAGQVSMVLSQRPPDSCCVGGRSLLPRTSPLP